MTETPASIHAFWFGAEADDALLAQERARLRGPGRRDVTRAPGADPADRSIPAHTDQ